MIIGHMSMIIIRMLKTKTLSKYDLVPSAWLADLHHHEHLAQGDHWSVEIITIYVQSTLRPLLIILIIWNIIWSWSKWKWRWEYSQPHESSESSALGGSWESKIIPPILSAAFRWWWQWWWWLFLGEQNNPANFRRGVQVILFGGVQGFLGVFGSYF